MKFTDSIIVKKKKAKNDKETNSKKLLSRRIVAYCLYFIMTHALASLFFIPLYTHLSNIIIILLALTFYLNHLVFLLTAFINPGYVKTNFVPEIDANAYAYTESKKPEDESSVIESNYKLELKTDSKRSYTQGNVSKRQMPITNANVNVSGIGNSNVNGNANANTIAQHYIKTIVTNDIKEDNPNNNNTPYSHINNFNAFLMKGTSEQIAPMTPIDSNGIPLENINEIKEKGEEMEESNNNVSNNHPTTGIDHNTTSPSNPKPNSNEVFNIYCLECLIEIPLRAKHCIICNKCIGTFDHHCTWIGNCIGERNKALFILFLILHSLILGFSFIQTLFYFKIEIHLSQWLSSNWSLLLYDWFAMLFFSFVFSILVFQLKILFVNQTSWENYSWHKIPYMRKYSGSQKSPFNYGLCKNISFLLCRREYFPKVKKEKEAKDTDEAKKNDGYKNIIDWKTIVDLDKKRKEKKKSQR